MGQKAFLKSKKLFSQKNSFRQIFQNKLSGGFVLKRNFNIHKSQNLSNRTQEEKEEKTKTRKNRKREIPEIHLENGQWFDFERHCILPIFTKLFIDSFLLLALKVSRFIQTYVIGNCRSFSNFRCPTATGTSGPSG